MCAYVWGPVEWGEVRGGRDGVRHMTDIKFYGITLLCSLGLMFNQEKFEGKRMILKSHFHSCTEF